MRISNLILQNVRCHSSFSLDIDGSVLFNGANGTGKTSILESIILALNLRTFRKQSLKEVVAFNEKFLRIETQIQKNNREYKNLLYYSNSAADNKNGQEKTNKIVLKSNNNIVDNHSEYVYNNPVFAYSPNSDNIISSETSIKRKQLDKLAFFIDKEKTLASEIVNYKRLLTQKNNLLQEQIIDTNLIDIYNNRIIKLSKAISKKRRDSIQLINKKLEETYQNIPLDIQQLYLKYTTNIEQKELFQKELDKKSVYYGIQRDRVYTVKDSMQFDKYSSFGQVKTLILLCVYSYASILKDISGEKPIILLDDFGAGLDQKRKEALLELFKPFQCIITGVETKISNMPTVMLS